MRKKFNVHDNIRGCIRTCTHVHIRAHAFIQICVHMVVGNDVHNSQNRRHFAKSYPLEKLIRSFIKINSHTEKCLTMKTIFKIYFLFFLFFLLHFIFTVMHFAFIIFNEWLLIFSGLFNLTIHFMPRFIS